MYCDNNLYINTATSQCHCPSYYDMQCAYAKCQLVVYFNTCTNFDLLATAFSMCCQGESLAVGSKDYNWVTTKSQLECGDEY